VTPAKITKLEQKGVVVQSKWPDTFYVISHDGNGMWIVSNDKEIAISGDSIKEFSKELLEVWKLHGEGRFLEMKRRKKYGHRKKVLSASKSTE
jgi:hypothetical protein